MRIRTCHTDRDYGWDWQRCRAGHFDQRWRDLERIYAVRTVLLDKTGTITRGKPELTDVIALPGYQEDNLLRLVAIAEQGSEHPLASAIVEGAKARGLALTAYPERFTAIAGRGLEAAIEGHELLIGTRGLLRERSITITPLEEQLTTLETQGKTAMLVAIDGKPTSVVAVAVPSKQVHEKQLSNFTHKVSPSGCLQATINARLRPSQTR